jgi:aspartate/methionine/tyrosine aminotransferase
MDLRPFELERYFAKYEFTARYMLSSSDCESLSVEELLKLEPDADAKLKKLWLGYIDSRGGPELRSAIAAIYSGFSAEEILTFSGAEEAIFLFMQVQLKPGDEIIVHQPCYQSLAEVPRALGAKVLSWQGRFENGWALDFDELENLATKKTRAVVVNLPHNPTGFLMGRQEFARLAEWSKARGIVLFCDEVYRESEYQESDRLPAACELGGVSLGVLSKTYGLAGLRIGWLASRDTALLDRIAGLKDYTTICNSAPSEFLAAIALRHREKLASRNRGIIQANMKVLDAFFERHSDRLAWVRPRGGSLSFPKLLKGDVPELCRKVVTEAGVMLAPGSLFGPFENHFRLGFGRKNMPEALALFERFL